MKKQVKLSLIIAVCAALLSLMCTEKREDQPAVYDSSRAFTQYLDELQGSAGNYVRANAQVAIELSKQYNVPAYLILGTAILESGSGQSLLATRYNNHFGITGKGVKMPDNGHLNEFRIYAKTADSYEDFCRLLNTERYAAVTMLNGNWEMQAIEMQNAGYATQTDYAARLTNVIEKYSLWKIDRIQAGEFTDFINN